MFCGNHGVVCCYVCFSIDHKSCKKLHYITNDIDELYNKSETEETQSDLNRLLNLMAIQQERTDRLIKELKDSRKSAIQEIRNNRSEINQILDKLEAESIQELDRQLRMLESKLLEEKQRYDSLIKDLTQLSDLIKKANQNRTQTFVRTNLGQQKSAWTEKEKKEREAKRIKNIQTEFAPVEKLRKLVEGLTSLGITSVTVSTVHSSLYKAKKIADIRLKLSNDGNWCDSLESCILDDILFITDSGNDTLERFKISTLNAVDSSKLPRESRGVCCTGPHEVAVACRGLVQFVSVRDELYLTRQFSIGHYSSGIGYNKDKLYITDRDKSLYMYDMAGQLLQTITKDTLGNPLFLHSRHIAFSDDGDMVFVADGENGLVCLTADGKHVKTVKNKKATDSVGVCGDGRGNVFHADTIRGTITQYSQDGNERGTVVKSKNCYPTSIAFHQRLNRLVAIHYEGNKIRVFELH